jgi:hypothetical protein
VPTVAVLGQERRWASYPVIISLLQNYFSTVGQQSQVVRSDVLATYQISTFVGSPVVFKPTRIGRVIRSFGIDPNNVPSISTTGIQMFLETAFRGWVRGLNGFYTADGWGNNGQRALPGYLLDGPGNGGLSDSVVYVVLGGDATSAGSTVLWSIVVQLLGGGRHSGILVANLISQSAPTTTRYSNFDNSVEPKLQLSVEANVQGNLTNVRLLQFDLQK